MPTDAERARAEAALIVARGLTVLAPLFDRYRFCVSVGQATTVEVNFTGPLGKPQVERLIRHLDILRDSVPDEAAAPLTADELATVLRESAALPRAETGDEP